MDPLFHPNTQKVIDDFTMHPSHALLIVGPLGSGKGFAAQYVASRLLNIPFEKVLGHPYIQWLHDLDKGIAIEQIRNAQTFMQLKVPGKANLRRALILEQGETMSTEAQNAFLKLLEEPPADSLIILTVASLDLLLPTIRSRAQVLQTLSPSQEQVNNYYREKSSNAEISRAYHLSEGYTGLMHALLCQDTDHPLVTQIAIAKSLLGDSMYDRLAKVDELVKQKNIPLLLQALERVCHAALGQAVNTGSANSKRWAMRLRAVVNAQQRASMHVQSKLLLTNLMLEL